MRQHWLQRTLRVASLLVLGSGYLLAQTTKHFLASLTLVVVMIVVGAVSVIGMRWLHSIELEKRANAFLAQHPGAEGTSVFVALRSCDARGKQQEIDNEAGKGSGFVLSSSPRWAAARPVSSPGRRAAWTYPSTERDELQVEQRHALHRV